MLLRRNGPRRQSSRLAQTLGSFWTARQQMISGTRVVCRNSYACIAKPLDRNFLVSQCCSAIAKRTIFKAKSAISLERAGEFQGRAYQTHQTKKNPIQCFPKQPFGFAPAMLLQVSMCTLYRHYSVCMSISKICVK